MTNNNLNYLDALAVKSDDELRSIIEDEKAYDAGFVSLAREEFMERTLGRRKQRTEEEIASEKPECKQSGNQKAAETPVDEGQNEGCSEYEIKETELPLGKHAGLFRALFAALTIVSALLCLVGFYFLPIINKIWGSLDYEDLISISRWRYILYLLFQIAAFGMIAPLSSNRQIKTGIFILLSSYITQFIIWVIYSLLLDSSNFSNYYGLYLFIPAIVYGLSVIIRNNYWRDREKTWVLLLVILSCFDMLTSCGSSMDIFAPGSSQKYYGLRSNNTAIINTIIWTAYYILNYILLIKLAYSSAFTGNHTESPLVEKKYSPLNKYVLAAVAALIIRTAADGFMAMYIFNI